MDFSKVSGCFVFVFALSACGLLQEGLKSDDHSQPRSQQVSAKKAQRSLKGGDKHSFSTTGASGVGAGERIIGGSAPSHTEDAEPGTLQGSGGHTIGYNRADQAPRGIQTKPVAPFKNGLKLEELRQKGVLFGYRVLEIPTQSPYASLALKVGDVITMINGRPVQESDVTVPQLQQGRVVKLLQITRSGRSHRLSKETKSATTRAQ